MLALETAVGDELANNSGHAEEAGGDADNNNNHDARRPSMTDLEVTHGPVRSLPGNRRVQAHVAAVTQSTDILHVITFLQDKAEWSEVSCWPSAFRIASFAVTQSDDYRSGLVDDGSVILSRELEEDTLEEDCGDGDYTGGGEKLLHLLRRWDVYNCVVVVSVWEEGCSRFRKGPAGARYKVIVDCAKEVLEQCFYAATGSCIVSGSSDFATMASLHNLPASVSRADLREESLERNGDARCEVSGALVPARGKRAARSQRRKVMALQACTLSDAQLEAALQEKVAPKREDRALPAGNFMAERKAAEAQRHEQDQEQQDRRRRRQGRRGRTFRVQMSAPELSSDDVCQLRSLSKPHPALVAVWQQVGILLGHPDDETHWAGLRPLFASHSKLLARMEDFCVSLRALRRLEAWVADFYPGSDARNRILKASPIAWKVLDWLLTIASSVPAPAEPP